MDRPTLPVWVREWTLSCFEQVNPLLQTVQTYGFSPAQQLQVNYFNLLKNGFSLYIHTPVWERMWITSCPDWIKVFPQSVHWWGRSPVWILMCLCNLPLCSNPRPQWGHLYGFSFVWILRWTLKFSLTEKDLPHTSQTNGRSPKPPQKIINEFPTFQQQKIMINEVIIIHLYAFDSDGSDGPERRTFSHTCRIDELLLHLLSLLLEPEAQPHR